MPNEQIKLHIPSKLPRRYEHYKRQTKHLSKKIIGEDLIWFWFISKQNNLLDAVQQHRLPKMTLVEPFVKMPSYHSIQNQTACFLFTNLDCKDNEDRRYGSDKEYSLEFVQFTTYNHKLSLFKHIREWWEQPWHSSDTYNVCTKDLFYMLWGENAWYHTKLFVYFFPQNFFWQANFCIILNTIFSLNDANFSFMEIPTAKTIY